MWKEKLILKSSETIRNVSERSTGTLSQNDIGEYEVVDLNGTVVGFVTYTENTSISPPFKTSYRVRQRDTNGTVIVDKRGSLSDKM